MFTPQLPSSFTKKVKTCCKMHFVLMYPLLLRTESDFLKCLLHIVFNQFSLASNVKTISLHWLTRCTIFCIDFDWLIGQIWMCVPLSPRCRIFWIGLDWSTVLLLREIAAKLCFCTNATISNYFRTHQFGPKEAVWENPSLWWSLLSKLKRFLPRKRHRHHVESKIERTKYCS